MAELPGNSRSVSSNQRGPHKRIPELVRRHMAHPWQKPYSEHTLAAFAQVSDWLAGFTGEIILDACCGVGESTAVLAGRYPDARVIGVDKSALRTEKHQQQGNNYLVVRADLNDFWRLARDNNWQLSRHFLLYPNPYPKSTQVQKRWHASPAFADIIALGGQLHVRSNWDIYVQEFALALTTAGIKAQCLPYEGEEAMTPFERKYWASGQQSWYLEADLSRI